jgi:hypothetical protein
MRLGLIGWSVRTGCGQINRDLWDLGFADAWLVPRHPVAGFDGSLCPLAATICEREGDDEVYRAFLGSIDVLVFIESPCIRNFDIVGEARRRGVLVCCVPMMEWLPLLPWVEQVDVMWGPTRWSVAELQRYRDEAASHGITCHWKDTIIGGRWGVDVDRFPFRQRTKAETFLFCNGGGGCLGRKGARATALAAHLAPSVPILFRSQKSTDLPPLPSNVTLSVENAADKWSIYDRGDVLIAPSRFEGLGLQHYEAQACGLPVITTAAGPMDECNPLVKVPAYRSEADLCGRPFPAWDVDISDLATTLRAVHGRDISKASLAAREFVEREHNLRMIARELRAELESRKK